MQNAAQPHAQKGPIRTVEEWVAMGLPKHIAVGEVAYQQHLAGVITNDEWRAVRGLPPVTRPMRIVAMAPGTRGPIEWL